MLTSVSVSLLLYTIVDDRFGNSAISSTHRHALTRCGKYFLSTIILSRSSTQKVYTERFSIEHIPFTPTQRAENRRTKNDTRSTDAKHTTTITTTGHHTIRETGNRTRR